MRTRDRRSRAESPPTALLREQVEELARPLAAPVHLDPLLEQIGSSRCVLLGEASHGTAEYYRWRSTLSQRLIEEKGFSFIAVEGDWPDCYRINRYVKAFESSGNHAREVLHAFDRWPTWMWANEEVVELVEWLRAWNHERPEPRRVGFYGLDVYSLWESLYLVMSYLHRVDPAALPAAHRALRCFEPFGEDVQAYARATRFVATACEDEVVALLREVRSKAAAYRSEGREGYFQAEQNALVLKNAESYYRAMVRGGPQSWNIRDRHMAETLDHLLHHHGPDAKAIVWAHNTHIGDARFTDMAGNGMVNLGELVREQRGGDGVVLVGLGSFRGSVIAGRQWDAPAERMTVPPARDGSWERVLHEIGAADRLLILTDKTPTPELLEPRGHRAIGVVYDPELEEYGNYVPTILPGRYDAFLYFDETQALHPMPVAAREEGEVPETFPSGV